MVSRRSPKEVRPRKDQPFYHLLAENSETEYIAYVSEQNLLEDAIGRAGQAPAARASCSTARRTGSYAPKGRARH